MAFQNCLLLELNFFHRCFKPAPKNQAEIYHDILHISRATHDRHVREAIEQLGSLLIAHLRPSLRLEQPMLRSHLMGRQALLQQSLQALQAKESVALIGMSGVGKSALGTAILQAWQTQATFWFTFRPGFNDQLGSLLFALGYFLHQQGVSGLWLQLTANEGRIADLHLALALVRHDLLHLQNLPLFCFDETDLIRSLDPDTETIEHLQLFEFINSLLGLVPLLLIGQRAIFTTDHTYSLNALSATEIEQWLQHHRIVYTISELTRLKKYTGGNPRLLELCRALYRVAQTDANQANQTSQLSFNELLDLLPQAPAVAPIWDRLQRRLHTDERTLLQMLAVFRNPAPKDAWSIQARHHPNFAATLAHLIDWGLLQEDRQGGIFLLPVLRERIYHDLPIEQREQFHLLAAQIRRERSEVTAAAYHYQQGGKPEVAIDVWYPQRQQEILRGQGSAALSLFQQISLQRLSPNQQERLTLLRAELYQLAGQPEKTIQDLAKVTWQSEQEAGLDALLLWGDALRVQGQQENALDKYKDALILSGRMLNKVTQIHVRRSRIYAQQQAFNEVWREVNLARYMLEDQQGAVQDLLGNYAVARSHYRIALSIAEDLNDQLGIARTYQNLSVLFTHQQEHELAEIHLEKSLNYYKQIGDKINTEIARSMLVGVYINAKKYEQAIEQGLFALKFFESLKDATWIAQNAVNLAEAYFEMGNFSLTQTYAEKTLDQEDPGSHPYALFNLARVKQAQKQYAEAEMIFLQAKQIAKQNQDPFVTAYILKELGKLYTEQQKFQAGREALSEAIQGFERLGIAPEVEASKAILQSLEAKS